MASTGRCARSKTPPTSLPAPSVTPGRESPSTTTWRRTTTASERRSTRCAPTTSWRAASSTRIGGCSAWRTSRSPGNFDRIIASVIGQSPNNLDLIIEINKGSSYGIRVGMPVVNPAGALIGKVTAPVTSDRARVMLITDPNYAILVKIVRPERLPEAASTTTTAVVAGGRPPRRRVRHRRRPPLRRHRRQPFRLPRRRCPIPSARPDRWSAVASMSHRA